MQDLKENDKVYTSFGYGIVVKPPAPKSSDQEKKPEETTEKVQEENSSSNPEPERRTQVVQEEKIVIPEPLRSPSITEVKMVWGGSVFLEEKEIKRKIQVRIKTFYGNRKTISLECDIGMTVQHLKNVLIEHHLENSKTLYNLRLIYPMASMQELSVGGNSLEHYKIPHNGNLILLAQTAFTWDPVSRGSGIRLSNSNLTAAKVPGADYQTALGNLVMSSGSHYWEIKIDRYSDEEDLFIGVAKKEIDLYVRPMDTKMFWGYMAVSAKKIGPDGSVLDYGYQAKKGDTIGVLLEYRSGLASLSFYRNETKCGVAFSNLAGSFYPAVSMYYGEVQVTLDSKAPMPIS